jgi:hypothetical protein
VEKFRVTVEVEVDGDPKEMQKLLADYLASGDDCTFFDDYGYKAWGGYEGPFAVAVKVLDENGVTLASHASRGKACSECGDYPLPEGVSVCEFCNQGEEG